VGFQFGAGGGSYEAEGDLDKDKISVVCMFSLIGVAVGVGNFRVAWNDIGSLQGKGFGAGIPAVVGKPAKPMRDKTPLIVAT
jgi:hypothetical protein